MTGRIEDIICKAKCQTRICRFIARVPVSHLGPLTLKIVPNVQTEGMFMFMTGEQSILFK